MAKLGEPRVLVWERMETSPRPEPEEGLGVAAADIAHPTPTPVEVLSPFLLRQGRRGFWGASDLYVPLAWKPALGQAAGRWVWPALSLGR